MSGNIKMVEFDLRDFKFSNKQQTKKNPQMIYIVIRGKFKKKKWKNEIILIEQILNVNRFAFHSQLI